MQELLVGENDGPIADMGSTASPRLPTSTAAALQRLDEFLWRGETVSFTPQPSGFQPLDRYLDGGLRPGELVLIGGAPGVGKTTLTLQMARNLAAQANTSCIYVCYEHGEMYLLQRLIALESFLAARKAALDPLALDDVHQLLIAGGKQSGSANVAGLASAIQGNAAAALAISKVQQFGQRLYLVRASGAETGVSALRRMVRELKEQNGPRVAVFVDYLQKVPVFPTAANDEERTTRVANDLKDLALSEEVPVVAVVAADHEGLRAQRLRMHHLRGSTSLAYEADATLILNNKYRIVAKKAITFNPYQAKDFRNWVICTLEKNRSGRDQIDLEFQAFFAHAAFDPVGNLVAESLIDERIEE